MNTWESGVQGVCTSSCAVSSLKPLPHVSDSADFIFRRKIKGAQSSTAQAPLMSWGYFASQLARENQ